MPRALILAVLLAPAAVHADAPRTADARCHDDPVCVAAAFADMIATTTDRLELRRVVEFSPGATRVYSESREKLARIARLWRSSVGWAVINVDGYAHARGRTGEGNQGLARRRAERIRGYLIRYGVDPAYVVVTGHPGGDAEDDGRDDRHVDLVISRCVRAEGACLPGPAETTAAR